MAGSTHEQRHRQGWQIVEGVIQRTDLSDRDIWHYFNVLFSTKSKNQSSYKFVFLRALLENIYNVDTAYTLSFSRIYDSFTRTCWNLAVRHALTQTDSTYDQSAVERILRAIQRDPRYAIPDGIVFDSIPVEAQLRAVREVTAACKRFVVGAVYADTGRSFYEFSLARRHLRFNPTVYVFLQEHQAVLFRLNNYELAKFLEKNNPADRCRDLLGTVEEASRRGSLAPFRELLDRYDAGRCFYCGRVPLRKPAPPVDHFIPWSFVHDDKLWNLVLSCSSCNSSKKDKVPVATFLDTLRGRNAALRRISDPSMREAMDTYSDDKLEQLYAYARANGHPSGWSPPPRFCIAGTSGVLLRR